MQAELDEAGGDVVCRRFIGLLHASHA